MDNKKARTWNEVRPYVWVAPALLVLAGILIYPWAYCFYLSFHSWSPLKPGKPKFVGLGNYVTIFTDDGFYQTLGNTLLFVSVTICMSFLLGFAIALLLNKVKKGRGFLFAMLLVPMMLPHSMVGLMWKFFYHSEFGLFNWIRSLFRQMPVGWLSDPKYALLSVIIVEIWGNTPFVLMTLFAGIQSISENLYEAARLDGATSGQQFRYITIPALKPMIVVVLLFRVMHAIRVFDIVYSLFRSGGPGNSASLIGVYLYQTYKVTWKVGLSSAVSVVLLLLTVLITLRLSMSMYSDMEG